MATQPSPTPNDSTRDVLASLRINREPERAGSGRWWKILLVLAILGAAGWFGFQYAQNSGMIADKAQWVPEMMQNRVEVKLETVKVRKGRSADAVVVATGYLESRRQARIGARAAGQVDIVTFEEGNKVKKGEVLAELEHKDLKATLAASAAAVARAQASIQEQTIMIEQAKIDNARSERLWKSHGISRSEYDVARFAYRSSRARYNSLKSDLALAEAQMNETQQRIENMFIRAPFDGTVISKDAEVGESIMPGGMGGSSGRGSVATIADLDHLEIECDVQENYISRVKEGQEVDIAVDAVQDKKYQGEVRKIIPMGDRARATIKVKVKIVDADDLLFPEMAGTVFFLPEKGMETNDEPRMFCSSSAIQTAEDGSKFVWISDSEKRADKVAVKTGEERDGKTEITDGLAEKDRVVVKPKDLEVGTPLRIIE